MSTTSSASVAEMLRQATQSFQLAIKSGMAFQEETTENLVRSLGNIGTPLERREDVQAMARETAQALRQSVDGWLEWMNRNAHLAIDSLEKAWSTAATDAKQVANGENGPMLLESAVNTLRANARLILEANSRVLDSWGKLAEEVASRVEEVGKRPSA